MVKMELVIKNRRKCKVILNDDWTKILNEEGNQAISISRYTERNEESIIITCVPLRPSIICDTIEFVFDAKTQKPLGATYINYMDVPEYDFKFTVNKLI